MLALLARVLLIFHGNMFLTLGSLIFEENLAYFPIIFFFIYSEPARATSIRSRREARCDRRWIREFTTTSTISQMTRPRP